MKRKTLYEKFGDRLLEEEDKAGPMSYKRCYIAGLHKDYISKRLMLYIVIFIIISITIFFLSHKYEELTPTESKIIKLSMVLLTGAGTYILATRLRTEKKEEMDEYARKKFDKDYGKGAYDKTMEQIKK